MRTGRRVERPGATDPHWGDQRGGDRLGARQLNERLIIQAIRRAGGLPKADIARLLGLSPQTVSVVVNRLLAEDLLVKTDKLRGKVGQPSTMIQLNPAGACAVGIEIGRRGLDILLMDIDGGISRRSRCSYRFPLPHFVFREIERGIAFVCQTLSRVQRERLLGIGVCAPNNLDRWADELEAPPEKLAEWRDIDIGGRVAAMTDLPVYIANDVAAATSAELTLGTAIAADTCLYLYIGAFIGGGVVLSGQVLTGARDNACAIGSLPLTGLQAAAAGRAPEQLIRRASLNFLERELEDAGFELDVVADPKTAPPAALAIYDVWRRTAVAALAYAIDAAISILDVQQVVIDGSLPRPALEAIVTEVGTALDLFNMTGLRRPDLALGDLGSDARVLGAALLPINAELAPDRNLLLKLASESARQAALRDVINKSDR